MPNWVKNVIRVTGKKEDISAMLQRVKSDDRPFDFENLIPMPKSLDITSGGIREDAMLFYISDGLKLPIDEIKQHRFVNVACKYSSAEEQVRHLREYISLGRYTPEELWENGKIYVENLQNYGATDWYDWACNNWGTKWNACEAEVCRESPTECWIYFDTAWSLPQPILRKLVSEYPQLLFEGKWADEDLGRNCGRWCSDNYGAVFMLIEDLAFACDVWGYDYDEICDEYGYNDEEEPPVETDSSDDDFVLDEPFSIAELIAASHEDNVQEG